MGAARTLEELTPRARQERAMRMLLDAQRELTAAILEELEGKGEWIGWKASPFPSITKSAERARRRFNALARSGKVRAKREGRAWLINRDDLNRYFERSPSVGRAAEDDSVQQIREQVRERTSGARR